LLGADPHVEQLFYRGDPLRMSGDERVILQRVFRALYVSNGQRMRRVLKAEVDNILWSDGSFVSFPTSTICLSIVLSIATLTASRIFIER
jgi:hypothetical protein